MAETSKIEWTDATWNPVTGCSITSPGCTNCYAMKLAGGRLRHHPSRKGLTQPSKAGPVWTGEVRFNEGWLRQPLEWRKPKKIFVCAHSDLFHPGVPNAWRDRIFAIMALAPEHIYQVLTKRPDLMRAYITDGATLDRITDAMGAIEPDSRLSVTWPMPHVWLGTSVEDQVRADERLKWLCSTPAEVRFVSAEPLLGEVDMEWALDRHWVTARLAQFAVDSGRPAPGGPVHLVIVGGESGSRARDMDPAWAESLMAQCDRTGASFFMKQMAHKAEIPPHLMVRQMPGDQ